MIIAGAIVFAGLLIAGGVYLGGNSSTPTDNGNDNTPTANGNQNNGGGEVDLTEVAVAAGVDGDEFDSCVSNQEYTSEVQAEFNNAQEAGGRGTPYSVFVLNDPLSDSARNQISGQNITVSEDGLRVGVSGALPAGAVRQFVNLMLNDPEAGGDVQQSSDIAITPVSDEDWIRGDQDAEVVVVEYSDIDCPFCQQFHQTMNQVTADFSDDELGWVFRHFPLAQLHPDAPRKALAAECVGQLEGNNAFWQFVDELFQV